MTFTMFEFFCENDYWLKDVNYFRQKVSSLMFLIFTYFYIIIDVFFIIKITHFKMVLSPSETQYLPWSDPLKIFH